MADSKLARGSFFILIGNVIFRIGGYLYRFLMATLLGPAMYGILGLTLPFQGIFQILAAGGLPPAIAKYVAEYNATNQKNLARQTILTSLKIMIILGLVMGFLMIFLIAPWLANDIFHNPNALLPLEAVGLITPFSVIVGAFRGAFQAVYKMEYIVATRAVEQIFMILCATAFVLIGLQAFGAVLGSVVGFFASSISGVYIYKKYMGEYIQKTEDPNWVFTKKDELKLAKQLVLFSIPVTITAIAEMVIFSISTLIMGVFLSDSLIGYYTAADPIARLPLIVSTSIATTILPAASAAYSTKNKKQLDNYVFKSYEYSLLLTAPLCIFTAIFSKSIMRIVYFTNPAYTSGALALSILVLGMTFYSIYAVSNSIIQGIGYPRISMYILLCGSGLNAILNWFLIQEYGIAGGALATTLATFILMIPTVYITFRVTKAKIQHGKIMKVIFASLIMGLAILFIPNNPYGLVLGIVVSPIVYILALVILKIFETEDIEQMKNLQNKLGPLKGVYLKIVRFIEENGISKN